MFRKNIIRWKMICSFFFKSIPTLENKGNISVWFNKKFANIIYRMTVLNQNQKIKKGKNYFTKIYLL